MPPARGTHVNPVDDLLADAFLDDCPAWTRIEPQSVSGDPTPGIEARVHDAAWLLARQWQMGEFQGEDVGSAVFVEATRASTPVDGWRPRPGAEQAAGPMHAFGPDELLEPAVESEPRPPAGLRRRFEAGAQLMAMLDDAGLPEGVRAQILAACRLPAGAEVANPPDAAAERLARLLRERVPDAETIALALDGAAAAGPRPPWLTPQVAPIAAQWLAWYRGVASPDCWIEPRLEYAFDVAAGPHVLSAPAFPGGRVDWYHFDHVSEPAADTATREPLPPVWATPLRYPGMPADRYWEFEDAQVNLGALEAAPHDLARLALAEFALVSSQDWLVVPVPIPIGAVTTIRELSYTTTFGERIPVERADDPDRFQLFEIEGLPGLLVAPATPGVLEGPAQEDVLFLRDETANLAWAVEQVVSGLSGDPRARADEFPPDPPKAGTGLADLAYWLQSAVSAHWIPLVPMAKTQEAGDRLPGIAAIELRKGAMLDAEGEPVLPAGVLLRPGEAVKLYDEEVPRDGVRVRRVPVLARRPDGSYVRWMTRRVNVGRGDAASNLAFDAAIPRTTDG